MKAKDWSKKFVENSNIQEVMTEFALETRELVDLRTKKSDVKTKNDAIDGAMREQRQKWDAICRQTNVVSPANFDVIIQEHLTDITLTQQAWKNKSKEEKDKPKQEKVKDGRKLVGIPVVVAEK